MEARRDPGQATVEQIGIVVVVALLLAAVSVWVSAAVRDAGRPPPVVERVLAPQAPVAPALDTPHPDIGVAPRPRRGRLSGILRATARTARRVTRLAGAGGVAFAQGFAGGLATTVREAASDPAGILAGGGAVSVLVRDPVGLVRAELAAARDYARAMRALPPDRAYRRLMRDLGRASADVAVTRGKQLATRAAVRAVRRRLSRSGAAPGHPRPK